MAFSTRAQLRNKLRANIKMDRLGKVWDNASVDDAIDTAISEVFSRWDYKWDTSNQETSFNSVAAQMEYDVETNIPQSALISLVTFKGAPIYEIKYKDLLEQYPTLQSWTPTHYYLYNGKIGLHPIPTTNGDTIDVTYDSYWEMATADDSNCPFSTDFDRAIVNYAAYHLLMDPADWRNQQKAFAKFNIFEDLEIPRLFKKYLVRTSENLIYKNTYIPRQANNGRRVTNKTFS